MQSSPWTGLLLIGTLVALGGVAFILNFSRNADANGIQQIVVISDTAGNPNEQARPSLFVASPQHNSVLSTNTVQYNARYTWISCGNRPTSASLKVYEHVIGGKISGAGTMNEWRLLGEKSVTEGRRCHPCDERLPMNLTLTGTFTLPSLVPGGSTTLWTVGTSGDWKPAKIYDFTWLTMPIVATPTPSISPSPSPTPVIKIKEKGLKISKTDHKTLLRPGNNDAYEIVVQNTGEIDFHDLDIVDTLPSNLTIQSVGQGGAVSGKKVTWTGVELNAGESKKFTINVKVNANTANNTNLHNVVTATTNDNDLSDDATDDTLVQVIPQVKGITTVVPPAPVQPVPVSARTGAEAPIALALSTLFGGSGLAYMVRKGLVG